MQWLQRTVQLTEIDLLPFALDDGLEPVPLVPNIAGARSVSDARILQLTLAAEGPHLYAPLNLLGRIVLVLSRLDIRFIF